MSSFRRRYECFSCNKLLESPNAYRHHIRVVHNGTRPHECDVCGKKFARTFNLRTHRRTHTGEQPYKCVTCGRAFTQPKSLQKHNEMHIRKPYRCLTCPTMFKREHQLATHLEDHKANKMLACEICNRLYKFKSDYKLHLRTHTKPHSCAMCPKRFATTNALDTHTRKHHTTNRVMLKCTDCGASFADVKFLIDHLNTVHARPFGCKECRHQFATSEGLKYHIARAHHNDDNTTLPAHSSLSPPPTE